MGAAFSRDIEALDIEADVRRWFHLGQPEAPEADRNVTSSHRIVARDGVSTAAEMQRDQELASRQERIDGGPAASTVAALEYLIAQNDPARLCAWLAKRPGEERRALKSLMVPT